MVTTKITNWATRCCSLPIVIGRNTLHRNIQLNRRVPHGALVMLERSAAKGARCVLRGLGEGDLAWLPGACGERCRE
jgi:hypothetical protein